MKLKKKCEWFYFKNSNNRLLIIPIGIELAQGSHANILIYDKKNNTIERFEPNGKEHPLNFYYNPNLLDTYLHKTFEKYFLNVKYLKPSDFLPKIGFQLYDANETKKTKIIGDPGGYCVAWCFWYAYNRALYIDIPPDQLVITLIIAIKKKNQLFRDVIRSFAKNITNIRDDILIKVDIDINDWINNNVTSEQVKHVHELIQKLI